MAKTIAICNQKGGVGKTTTTLNLGVGLARQGKRVLLCDADPQSDLTAALGWNGDTLEKSLGRLMYLATQEYKPIVQDTIIHHPEGVDLIPSNLDLSSMESQLVNAMSREKVLANLLKDVKKNYDYILIDCMPSLGMITINALTAADSVVIPVQAQYLPAKGLEQLLGTINKVKKQINPKLHIEGILLTMVEGRTNFSKDVSRLIRDTYGSNIRVFDAEIPKATEAAETSAMGFSIFKHDPNGKVAKAYTEVTKEVIADAEARRRIKLEKLR
jgi:chromosome partitioning protein